MGQKIRFKEATKQFETYARSFLTANSVDSTRFRGKWPTTRKKKVKRPKKSVNSPLGPRRLRAFKEKLAGWWGLSG